jgi:hypothetical protein
MVQSIYMVIFFAWIGLIFVPSSYLLGQEILPPLTLDIYIEVLESSDIEFDNKAWLKTCANFGFNLKPDKGPIGTGVFDRIICHPMDDELKPKDWRILFQLSDLELRIQITGHSKNLGEIVLPPPYDFLKSLEQSSFKSALILSILDRMPMMTLIQESNYSGFMHQTSEPFSRFFQSQNYVLYDLYYDQKNALWKGNVVDEISKNNLEDKNKKPQKLPLWAHLSQGVGLLAQNLQPKILDEYSTFNKKEKAIQDHKNYLDNISKLHVFGGKYAQSIKKNDIYKGGMKFSSFYYEYKFHPIWGIKSEFDLWPDTKIPYENVNATFYGYRFNVGTVMHMTILDRSLYLELVPRLGLWYFKVQTPLKLLNEFYDLNTYDTKNSLNLGFQGGVHYLQPLFRVFLYFGYDQKAINNNKEAHVNSSHLGINLYGRFSGVQVTDKIELQVYLFSFNEVNSISKLSESEGTYVSYKTEDFSYSSSYLGLGVAYQW